MRTIEEIVKDLKSEEIKLELDYYNKSNKYEKTFDINLSDNKVNELWDEILTNNIHDRELNGRMVKIQNRHGRGITCEFTFNINSVHSTCGIMCVHNIYLESYLFELFFKIINDIARISNYSAIMINHIKDSEITKYIIDNNLMQIVNRVVNRRTDNEIITFIKNT